MNQDWIAETVNKTRINGHNYLDRPAVIHAIEEEFNRWLVAALLFRTNVTFLSVQHFEEKMAAIIAGRPPLLLDYYKINTYQIVKRLVDHFGVDAPDTNQKND